MDTNELSKQIEFYSNAIVGFTVFQGLTFCYTFGTSQFFYNIMKSNPRLSIGLTISFLLVMVLSVISTAYLRNKLELLSGEQRPTIRMIYLGKMIVIVIFGTLQILITLFYGYSV